MDQKKAIDNLVVSNDPHDLIKEFEATLIDLGHMLSVESKQKFEITGVTVSKKFYEAIDRETKIRAHLDGEDISDHNEIGIQLPGYKMIVVHCENDEE